ncbi:hypothetical protein L1987_23917 [Smallanthus sonchifolius]|uniref:Uncharacterized protein n=1 Tax=Smallanthus sonchifolius TaxID=185202 RepID=A0ACB9IJL5_9ASTR|nr:hypothetical protein L1987_23917 [Smallanthus sonchifolius]
MDDHPAGGVDFGDVGHSEKANEMMKKYYVGEIDPSTIPVKRSYISSTTEKIYNSKETSQFILKDMKRRAMEYENVKMINLNGFYDFS